MKERGEVEQQQQQQIMNKKHLFTISINHICSPVPVLREAFKKIRNKTLNTVVENMVHLPGK